MAKKTGQHRHRGGQLLPVLVVGAFLAACSAQGYADLGQRLDVITPLGEQDTSTWLRATPEGTDLFVTGQARDQGDMGSALVRINPNTSTELISGRLILESDTVGVFVQEYRYVYPYEPEKSILTRKGSHRETFDPARRQDIAITYDEGLMKLSPDDEVGFHQLEDIIGRIEPGQPESAADILRIYNLAILTSQARLLGFGSSGMTEYLNETATYRGLLSGDFTVEVRDLFSPQTDIVFRRFQDLSAVILDGLQHTSSDLQAAGRMAGQVSFSLRRWPHQGAPMEGTVDYGNVRVKNGYAAGGYYEVALNGGEPRSVPYDVLTNFDLTDLTW